MKIDFVLENSANSTDLDEMPRHAAFHRVFIVCQGIYILTILWLPILKGLSLVLGNELTR